MNEKQKQLSLIDELKKSVNPQSTFYIETFGCQMNVHDSEKFRGILQSIGYEEVNAMEEADFIFLNTCTIRENATNKVYGRLGKIKHLKEGKKDLIVCVCGCMMQQEEVIDEIKTKYKKLVNIVFGTFNLYRFPELLKTYLETRSQLIDIWKEEGEIVEGLPTARDLSFKASVNIMYGCNNFCSYCIVPYVRGRERSRSWIEILEEVTFLAKDGVSEILLLGQNVNSYTGELSFPKLLNEISKVSGIRRIRFMTSHPKDLSDELIWEIKTNQKVCKHIHLPVQSGSTRILKEMSRGYSKEDYLGLATKIKREIPDVSLTTDIMVGFPGETDEDFCDTLDLIRRVGFDNVYSFIFSKRTGTKAAMLKNEVEEEVVSQRFEQLLKTIDETKSSLYNEKVGKRYEVLVEERIGDTYACRTDNNIVVLVCENQSDLIGNYINVEITQASLRNVTGVMDVRQE